LVGSIEAGQDNVTTEQVIDVVVRVETGEGAVLSGAFAKTHKVDVAVQSNAATTRRGHRQGNFIESSGND